MNNGTASLEFLASAGVEISFVSQAFSDRDEHPAPDTPDLGSDSSSPTKSTMERELASLKVYTDSLPYNCETIEEMQAKLQDIVAKISICVQSKDLVMLSHWGGMLQCWMLMRYPIPTATRAKLVRVYYELTVLPGVEPGMARQFADMVTRLLANKLSARRKLEPKDLQLPWQPLWRALKRELWPKKRLHDTSRNMLNILLYVAEKCKLYFPGEEVQNILSTFLSILTRENILTVIPVLTSFLPPTHIDLYVPVLFKIWEAFNSNVVDERLIELCGDLSEEHVGGKYTYAENGYTGPQWRDVGIWTDAQWTVLVGKALGSMNVPVGISRGSSTTASQADVMGEKMSSRIKKSANRYNTLARIFIYSMAVDGPIKEDNAKQPGYLAGSKALDSLEKLITSTESFFHPSNSGPWTIILTNFLQRLTAEFCKRWKEEEEPSCKTPITHKLTPSIRKAFVTSLRTVALLAMFSKDPISTSFAQGALRSMALLEPSLIMPELLERAYSGLEIVNETHRTTAVLSVLSGVAMPLVSEKRWLGGQKHILPLLELSLPGIDLNDPVKTLCATMFIIAAAQAGIKFGDLSRQTGLSFDNDAPGEEMTGENEMSSLPQGTDSDAPVFSREEERALVRDSTAGFADWVVSLFRRVFALFENLPEEGGKKNTVPKQEEGLLRSIKNTMDMVCVHLSDPLFDLVLKLVYDYATTNAKSNSVRAFGQLVWSLARAKPDKVIDKFLPFCIWQIQEELNHGASSVRTTSSHIAVPSDTTLHWNLSILRGCLGYDGNSLMKHRKSLLELLHLLIDKVKSERGYSSTGSLLTRIVHSLSTIYPLNDRFVNTEEWESPEFDEHHNVHWGRMYEAHDVEIEWHVPSSSEIDFILEILDDVISPLLDNIEALMETAGKWDNVARNDFCRYLRAVRSTWDGLPTLLQEQTKEVVSPNSYNEIEVDGLLVSKITVNAGFVLSDPQDPRYQKAFAHRQRFGTILHRAVVTIALRNSSEGEDHIDAVITIAKGIDVFLLEYGMSRSGYDALQKTYTQVRDINRVSLRQKENSRLAFLKRAQLYHASRLYLNALYRRRSALEDKLIGDLVELSLSPYTRVRRHCQTIVQQVAGYFVRSTRSVLPALFTALAPGTDPDRMKGALYLLWDKGIAGYALSDVHFKKYYLISLLECQHQEKPSIQKLVVSLTQDCLKHLSEEAVNSRAYVEDTPRVKEALDALETEFPHSFVDQRLLKESLNKFQTRVDTVLQKYEETIAGVLEIISRPTTHWRYTQIAVHFLYNLLQRNIGPSSAVARFLMENCVSPHQNTRDFAIRGVTKILVHIKVRTYSRTANELWFDEWSNPLERRITVTSHDEIMQRLIDPADDLYVDKIRTGFLTWTGDIKAYKKIDVNSSQFEWEHTSQPALDGLAQVLADGEFFNKLIILWGQESSRSESNLELRSEHLQFMKSIVKTFEDDYLDTILSGIEPLISDSDRFKQRACAEVLLGLLRGSKHWPKQKWEKLWSWTLERMDTIFAQIKPDTIQFWQSVFMGQLEDRDPRRSAPLVQWTLNLPLDFQGDSAFTMSKTLTLFCVALEYIAPRSRPLSDQFFKVLLDNANSGYNDMRGHIVAGLSVIISSQWYPVHQSVQALLDNCRDTNDPLQIRSARYLDLVSAVVQELAKWKEERLAPPRTNQSQYDKVGLTLLQWMWAVAYGSMAPLMFPYVMPMLSEILRMSELNDSSELQTYSTGVLYVLSAVTPPHEYVEVILQDIVSTIKGSTSWRIRLNALPIIVVFFYRNLLSLSNEAVIQLTEVLLDCLRDENVEVREMASTALSGVVRCSQRQNIIPLKNRFVGEVRKARLPSRKDPSYGESLRLLHSSILGLCALIESFPYSVEPWMPPLTDVLSTHATDPPPISTAIRKCASEFKKTHQDTWVKDQSLFDEEQLQNLSTMLVGTSYYA